MIPLRKTRAARGQVILVEVEQYEMEKMKHYLLLAVLVVALTGCSTVEPQISPGTYREKGTLNFIRVSGERSTVHINGVDDRDSNGAGLEFKYVLWSRGRLLLVVKRSAELLYGYPALEYYWDGRKIVARDTQSNLRWEFAPEPDSLPTGSTP